jgi:hypothetical protein
MRCHKEKCISCEIFAFVSKKSFECIGILNSIFLKFSNRNSFLQSQQVLYYLLYFTLATTTYSHWYAHKFVIRHITLAMTMYYLFGTITYGYRVFFFVLPFLFRSCWRGTHPHIVCFLVTLIPLLN